MSEPPTRILLVEDNPGDAELLRQMLLETGAAFDLVSEMRFDGAVQRLEEGGIGVVLLDLYLPDRTGYETFRGLQARAPEVPILVMTGLDDQELAVRAVREGAQDFLVKGRIDSELLGRAVRYAIERKRVERELRRAAHELRLLNNVVEQTTQPLAIMDFGGRLVRFNAAFEELTGRSSEELEGLSFRDLTPEDWRRLDEEQLANLMNDGQAVRYEKEMLGRGGSVPVEVVLDVYRGATGEPELTYAFITDISERRRTEEVLLQASRMEVASTLAGGVAHDFNNLMAVVLTNTELLRGPLAGRGELLEVVDEIAQIARRAGGLAQQMLSFARGGSAGAVPVILNAVIQESIRNVESRLENGLRITTDLTPDLWPVQADPAQMRQVATNLLTNAIEAMEGPGTIRVSTRNIVRDRPAPTGRLGRHVRLAVEDHGRGIEPEAVERVFEPFFTTKFQGRGLGLATVYGIVKSHGGHVTLESEPGQGTVFEISLPASVS